MRDVLTYCSDFRQWNACAGYAAELATTLGASLTGLHAGQPLPVMPAAGNVASGLAEWMAEATNEVHCAMLAGREFAAWARGQGVDQTHWQVALGDPRDVLEAAAATADLVVLGRPAQIDAGPMAALLRSVLLSGQPCIVVPLTSGVMGRLERIVVAWDGSAASTRSLHAAIPLLRKADDVWLLRAAHPHESEQIVALQPPFDPLAHLHNHGIEASQQIVATHGSAAGQALLAAASLHRADLLIAGASGKARRSEARLGDTTDYLLQHATLPLFLRH
jgi:nucleotide-binding universal stress UspA family protein